MKVAILTSGGDAPGMNACVLNLAKHCFKNQIKPYLVYQGYKGLVENQIYEVESSKLNFDYLVQQGSFIQSARYPNFHEEYSKAVNNLNQLGINTLIVIGGNGSYLGAKLLSENQINTIFIPATIDNDVEFTEKTIGFSSACQEVVDTSLKIKQTFRTHNNVCLVEVMGRYCSDLTIAASLAITPSICVTHWNKLNPIELANIIYQKYQEDQYGLVLVSEHLYSSSEKQEILALVEQKCNCAARFDVIGYVQRGAKPDWFDLSLANLMAEKAIATVLNNDKNVAIVYENSKVVSKNYNDLQELAKLGEKELSLIND